MMYTCESEIDRIIRLSERNELVKANNRYLHTSYFARIERISKKLIEVVSCKVRTVKRLQRARESHRKPFEESEEDK